VLQGPLQGIDWVATAAANDFAIPCPIQEDRIDPVPGDACGAAPRAVA
jgi:hypothetical protein